MKGMDRATRRSGIRKVPRRHLSITTLLMIVMSSYSLAHNSPNFTVTNFQVLAQVGIVAPLPRRYYRKWQKMPYGVHSI